MVGWIPLSGGVCGPITLKPFHEEGFGNIKKKTEEMEKKHRMEKMNAYQEGWGAAEDNIRGERERAAAAGKRAFGQEFYEEYEKRKPKNL